MTDRSGVLDGRVTLVTGSSRGIGAAIAIRFAQHGARVVVHGRDPAAVAAVRKQAGPGALAVLGDLTDPDAVEAIHDQVLAAVGAPHVLVACAGGSPTPPAPLEEISPEQWAAGIDTNLSATFLTLRAFIPAMRNRGAGSIITFSTSAVRSPAAGAPAAYTAAKAGIEALTRTAALQLGPAGIRVNAIAPATIVTDRLRARVPARVLADLAASHPLGRLGSVDDVADAALHLATDASAWTTGTTLDLSGGAGI